MTSYILLILNVCILVILYLIFKKSIKKMIQSLSDIFMIVIFLFVVFIIILYPENAVKAGLNGVKTWFNVILPALLPFFILSEILIGLGVVNFIGSMLQPLMSPIFNVPGEGAFTLSMSITSGYPVGAKVVSRLREQGTIKQAEAQRLVSFCSTSGPLFMIGAVSVGMFNNVTMGTLIAISHYLGALTVGTLFRFYKIKSSKADKEDSINIRNAFNELIRAREKDGRPIGVLMGDAVIESFNTMIMVGGFIIFYSVIIEVVKISKLLNLITYLLSTLIPFELNTQLLNAFLSGIIEMTNGCQLIASVESSNLLVQIILVSFLIAWSGLSIHSQAISMLNKTDIKINLYILSKLLHGLFSAFYSFVLYSFFFKSAITTSFIEKNNLIKFNTLDKWLYIFKFSLEIEVVIIITLFLIALLLCLLNTFKNRINKR